MHEGRPSDAQMLSERHSHLKNTTSLSIPSVDPSSRARMSIYLDVTEIVAEPYRTGI